MNAFKQAGLLYRFGLKKEWLKLSFWLLGCLGFVFVGVFAYTTIYAAPSDREAMAVAMSNPAMEALFGKMIGANDYTVGAMYSHTMTIMTLSLVAIGSILLIIRNTRVEEENGRIELLQALPVGRLAHTASAVSHLLSYTLVLGCLSTLLLIVFGDASMSLEGAVLSGALYSMSSLFFGSLALLLAQLTSSSRSATATSFSLLGVLYILRIIGDASASSLTLLSPLGLLYHAEAFVTNRWWPVVILLLISLVLIYSAFYLQTKRDLGSGLLPARSGTNHASSILLNPYGFVLRLMKTPLIIWTVSMMILALTYGSVMGDVESLIAGNEVIEQIIVGESTNKIIAEFLTIIIAVLSIATVIPAVQVMMKLVSEEKQDRLQYQISGTRSRAHILTVFMAVSTGSLLMIQVVQLATFAIVAVSVQDFITIKEIFLSGIVYLPAMSIFVGIATLLYGWKPKFISVIWMILSYNFFILYFGNLFDMPEWLKFLSPFYLTPDYLGGESVFLPLIIMAISAISFIVIGIIGFNKRDIMQG